jgi:hypothetical protein
MKKETLEEAAENYASKKLQRPITIYTPLESNVAEYVSFIKGAKWQQEQDKKMYSEEEVMDMFDKFSMHLPLHYEFLVKEQFKKK